MTVINVNHDVYLIQRLWVDCLQIKESKTFGYETIGFVYTQEEAEKYIDAHATKDFDVNDCWAIKGTIPEYKYEVITKIWI